MRPRMTMFSRCVLALSLGAAGASAHAVTVYSPSMQPGPTINAGTQAVRPYGQSPNGPTGFDARGAAKSSSSGTTFTAKSLPAANGSASSLCEAGTPGCANPVGQGDPVQGSKLLEPPSMAPHIAPPGPTRFEHVEEVRLVIPQPIHHQVFSAHSLFEFNSAKLSPVGQQRLLDVAHSLDLRHLHGVTVLAYTDSFGTQAYNDRLSAERAKSAAKALVEDGVPATMVYVNHFGKQDYLVNPESCHGNFREQKKCQSPNRRVVIETSGMSTLPVAYPLHQGVTPWSPSRNQ